jgi:hypothetical protein
MSTTPMNFGDWAGAAQNLVQIAAIVIGGAWAYYKFVRGRIFHRRAEVTLDASLLRLEASRAIRARAILENTGSADIPFLAQGLEVFSFRRGDVDDKGRPQWREVATVPVFEDHEWIESQETIVDEVLVPLTDDPEMNLLVYRVSCVVYGERERKLRRTKRGGGIRWTTNAIAPAHLVDADN